MADVDALADITALEVVTGAEELLLGEDSLGAAGEVGVLVDSAVGTLAVPLTSAAGLSVVD